MPPDSTEEDEVVNIKSDVYPREDGAFDWVLQTPRGTVSGTSETVDGVYQDIEIELKKMYPEEYQETLIIRVTE